MVYVPQERAPGRLGNLRKRQHIEVKCRDSETGVRGTIPSRCPFGGGGFWASEASEILSQGYRMLEISSAALGRRRGIKDNRAQGYIPFPLESQDRKNSRERLSAGLVSDGREFLTFLQQRGKAQCSPPPKGGRGPRVGGNWLNLRSRDSLREFLAGQGHFLGHILNTDAH